MPAGRPTTYSQELADKICEQLAMGLSIRTVCAPEGMPAISTFFKWLREHDEFSKQYARAKEESADAMAEEILHISDEMPQKIVGNDKSDGARVMAERARIDTRKFLMAKMKPKRYGDKVMHGNDPDNPLPTPIYGGLSALPGHNSDEEDISTQEAN